MISDTKPQNVIVVVTLILGIMSGIGLANSASYYSGSFVIVRYLDVSLDDVRVTNVDPTNETINPALYLDFNIKAPNASSGESRITFLTLSVFLNREHFQYAVFRKSISLDHQTILPGYDRTFTISSTVYELLDKQILYNATLNNEWIFSISMNMWYSVAQSDVDQLRQLSFSYNGTGTLPGI